MCPAGSGSKGRDRPGGAAVHCARRKYSSAMAPSRTG